MIRMIVPEDLKKKSRRKKCFYESKVFIQIDVLKILTKIDAQKLLLTIVTSVAFMNIAAITALIKKLKHQRSWF